MYAVTAHQLHTVAFLRRLDILSLGVVAPVSCSACCYFFRYAVTAHQLHTVAFLRRCFGHPLPWGGGPGAGACYFFMYAVAAHQLHRSRQRQLYFFFLGFYLRPVFTTPMPSITSVA
jgi:hypothetical protein